MMKRTFKTSVFFIALSLLGIVSCTEDSRYSTEKISEALEDGQEFTFFQNGLSIPIGSTSQLRLDSLLEKSGISDSLSKYLKVSEKGDYYILYEGSFNMDDFISDLELDEAFIMSGLNGNSTFNNHVGNISADELKVDKSDVSAQQSLGDFSDALNLELDTCNISIPTPGIGSVSFDMPVPIKPFTLPDGVKKINSVTLTNSSFTFDFGVRVTNLEIEFPSYMTVSGNGVSGNKLTLSQTSSPHKVIVNVTKLTFDDPSEGMVNFPTDPIKIKCNVTNNTVTKLVTKMEISDFEAVISGIEKDIITDQKTLNFSLDESFDNFGTITVYPVGTPKIKLSLSMPDLGTVTPVTDGILIQLPNVVRLKDVPSELGYNEENQTLTLKKLKTADYELSVDRLVITPVKKDNKCKVECSYGASGVVKVAETTVNRSTVSKVSGAEVSFIAAIPEVKAKSIEVSELKVDVDITEELTEFQKISIPDMLVTMGEIIPKDLYLNMSVNANGLPDIGDSKFQVDITVTAPSFVVPQKFPIKGTMTIKDSKATLSIDPLKIEKLDFSDIDIDDIRKGTIYDCNIRVNGTITAKNPVIDLNTIKSDVNGNINYTLYSLGNKNGIDVQSIEAKLDYNIDTSICVKTTSLKMPDMISEFVSDFPVIDVNTTFRTNTSVPVSIDMDVCLMKGSVADKSNPLISQSFEIPYSTDGTIKNKDYSLSLDLNRLFNEEPDSLLININGKTDKSKYFKFDAGIEYSMGLDYEISAPMQLGEDFILVLSDTLGIEGEIGEYLAGNSFGLSAKVIKTLPLGFKLEVSLLCEDSDGNVIRFDDVMPEPLEITAEETSDINLILDCNNSIVGKTVTGLIFTLTASASGECIRPDNFIQLTDIALQLPEGVTIDIKK